MGYRAKRLRVISVLDQAIDTDRMPMADMVRYFETRDESIVLPFIKPGVAATWVHLDVISHSLWEPFVVATPHEAEQHKRALMSSVRLVENLYQSDGVFIPSWEPPRTASGVMQEDSLPRMSPQERSEIGSVAFSHGFFPLRMPVLFRLPHLCLAALAARTFLVADANPSSPAPSSETASSDSAVATQSPQPVTASSNVI